MPEWLARYWERTRQPWAGILFVVPLLAGYEAGVFFMSPTPDDLRTGADAWLNATLARAGLNIPFIAPFLLLAGLIAWGWLTPKQALRDPLTVWTGMWLESALFAGLFFGLLQLFFPLLLRLGTSLQDALPLAVAPAAVPAAIPAASPERTWGMILRYLGAGIYEETIFRLVGFSLLRFLLLAGDVKPRAASVLAGVISAVLFAAAHHVAGGAEPISATVFLYQVFAGLFFAAVFATRGYGIAVGAHAGYDLLVGLILR